MATVTRRANAVWTGRLVEGGGKVAVGSGAFPPLDYELAGRTDSASAQTSPEELVAAAHASCLSMSCAATLSGRGAANPEVRVDASCTEGPVGDAYRITAMALTVTVRAAGLAEAEIAAAVHEAAADCPVSALMQGNVEVTLDVVVTP